MEMNLTDEETLGFRGDRVREHTAQEINRRIDEEMQNRVRYYSTRHPSVIDRRMEALNREWDMERVLEANASIAALTGLLLGVSVDRKWFLLPAVVFSFLLQHALQGWCPLVPVFRRLGVRTQREIEAEKYALKSLQKEKSPQLQGR